MFIKIKKRKDCSAHFDFCLEKISYPHWLHSPVLQESEVRFSAKSPTLTKLSILSRSLKTLGKSLGKKWLHPLPSGCLELWSTILLCILGENSYSLFWARCLVAWHQICWSGVDIAIIGTHLSVVIFAMTLDPRHLNSYEETNKGLMNSQR